MFWGFNLFRPYKEVREISNYGGDPPCDICIWLWWNSCLSMKKALFLIIFKLYHIKKKTNCFLYPSLKILSCREERENMFKKGDFSVLTLKAVDLLRIMYFISERRSWHMRIILSFFEILILNVWEAQKRKKIPTTWDS
jgi:hypothetical protein